MKTLNLLAIPPLLALTATATPARAALGTDAYASQQSETAVSEAPPQVAGRPPEDDRRVHRQVVRVGGRGGDRFYWSFGEEGARGYLGVGVIRLTPELRRHFGAPAERGVMVSRVVDDGPAAIAGIAVGDILLSVDDEAIAGDADLIRAIGEHGEGDTVSIEVRRDGTAFSVTPTLEERDRQVVDLMPLFRRDHPGRSRERLEELRIEVPNIDLDSMEKVIAIREKDIERAMGDLQERLNSPEFQARLEEATRHSAELAQRTAELERRLAEVQRRLDRLQKQQTP